MFDVSWVQVVIASVGVFWGGLHAGIWFERRDARIRETIRNALSVGEKRALAISDETGLHLHMDVHPMLRRMEREGEAMQRVDGLTPIGRPQVLWALVRD